MTQRRAKPHRPRVTAADVVELLGRQYGPLTWKPRYEPISELVFTILSQHTSDVNAERAFKNLMGTFGTVQGVASASLEEIEVAIRVAGLARIKAPRIKGALEQIYSDVGSYDLSFLRHMPLEEAKAWLRGLPGVGPKTAAVILCFSLGMPAMPVDTHVYRVARRLGLIGPKVSADQAHDMLEGMVSPEQVFPFHVYLITHGRRVCRAQRPRCHQCVLAWGCPSRDLFQPGSVPSGSGKTRGGTRG